MNVSAADVPREPPEGSLTAAEFVLGVLDNATHRAVQTRSEREPAFARDVALWQSRLAPLLNEIAPVPPPFAVWPRIRSAVGIRAHGAAARRVSLWQSLPLWRWLSASGFALAAASLAALFVATSQTPLPGVVQPMAATLASDIGQAVFVGSIDAQGNFVVLPVAVNIPADRVAELWLIPPGDAPHALGLLDAQHASRVLVPYALRAALTSKAIVAVSLEQPGGAPAGKPTGPIIAKGLIALL